MDTSSIISARFEIYDAIINTPNATLVADGFPYFEGLSRAALRDPAEVRDRLSSIADDIRTHYPDIDVSVGANHTPINRAIDIYTTTIAGGFIVGGAVLSATEDADGESPTVV